MYTAQMPGKFRDIFTIMKEEYGIDYTYFADRLGMTRQTFNKARKRGFVENETELLQDAIRQAGEHLRHVKIPESSRKKGPKWSRE